MYTNENLVKIYATFGWASDQTTLIQMYSKQPVACLVNCQSCFTFPGLTFPGIPDL